MGRKNNPLLLLKKQEQMIETYEQMIASLEERENNLLELIEQQEQIIDQLSKALGWPAPERVPLEKPQHLFSK